MFRLHESTRTFLCRLSFILLGLLPTCCCATYAIFVNRESYQKQLAVEIGRRLNVIANCRSASHPLPGVIRFVDFELRNPETNELLASAPILTISTNDERTLVTSPSVECDWQARGRFMRACDDRIQSGNAPQQPIEFYFGKVEITGLLPNAKMPLYHFTAKDGVFENGRDGAMGFFTHPNPGSDQRPTEIHLKRALDADPIQPTIRFPISFLSIDSGSTPLPCALIGGTDCVNLFGQATTLDGKISVHVSPTNQTTQVTGNFLGVDLEPLGKQFSQRLSGIASFRCDPLVIENGRVKTWLGQVVSNREGQMGRSLAKSLVDKFQIRDRETTDHISDINFNSFAFQIDWQDNSIRLFAFKEWQENILFAGNLPIWQEPGKLISPTAVLEAFKPEGLQTVPSISFLEKIFR